MKKVFLIGGDYALVDDEDFDLVSQCRWTKAKYPRSENYLALQSSGWVRGRRAGWKMHRLILDAQPGQIVDHRNRNGLDNRRENLRFVTMAQNNYNRVMANKTGFKGVYRNLDNSIYQYRVIVCANKQQYYLGRFKTAIEAAQAYDREALRLQGEFATLNFPNKE